MDSLTKCYIIHSYFIGKSGTVKMFPEVSGVTLELLPEAEGRGQQSPNVTPDTEGNSLIDCSTLNYEITVLLPDLNN